MQNNETANPVRVAEVHIEEVKKFTYLTAKETTYENAGAEIKTRIRTMGRLRPK